MPSLADSLVSSSARRLAVRDGPTCRSSGTATRGVRIGSSRSRSGCTTSASRKKSTPSCKCSTAHTSLDEIKERFEAEFPPQKITVEELGQFVGMLHRSGLVIADVPGQGAQLKKRRDERRGRNCCGRLSNILAIRFKGIDPDRLLELAAPVRQSFMYSTPAVICLLLRWCCRR